MTESKPEKILNIEGDRNASLFYHVLGEVVNEDTFKTIQEKIDSDFSKLEKQYDDRALAVVGALCIENALDKFLSTWLVKYEKYLKERIDFSFSSKIELAKSTKLIPVRILNSIEPIRKIRNTFAHHLEIDNFEKAKQVDSGPFQTLNDKIKTFSEWKGQKDRETFKTLVIFIIIAIEVYTKHVKKVKDYIWIPENLSKIIAQGG